MRKGRPSGRPFCAPRCQTADGGRLSSPPLFSESYAAWAARFCDAQ